MNRMIAITISPGATTAAVRLIVSGNAWPIIPPPAATSTRKNVPRSSEKSRRHSWLGSLKSSSDWDDLAIEIRQHRGLARRRLLLHEPLSLPFGLNDFLRYSTGRAVRGLSRALIRPELTASFSAL